MSPFRLVLGLSGLVLGWQAVILLAAPPPFILPAPLAVAMTLVARFDVIAPHAVTTMIEIALGLIIGTAGGASLALAIDHFRAARPWLLPLIVVSQAIPVFALAPILVLWLGYGLASKIAMAALVIFFPVTVATFDGLSRTDPGWLDLARTMAGQAPGARRRILFRVRLPAALPAFGSGVRVAAAVAPIGAVIGEWVGASSGLGYLMLHANGRMQTDLMFAALAVLAALALALYLAVDLALRRLIPWAPAQGYDDRATHRSN